MLFSVVNLRAVELQSEDIPELQRFFEANPEYFLAVEGRPAGPSEAYEELHSELPAGWSFTKNWFLGFVDDANSLVGMASLVSDFLALNVWHIGLFMVATARHGSGDAQALYQALSWPSPWLAARLPNTWRWSLAINRNREMRSNI